MSGAGDERRGGTLHWLHWTIVALSLALTLGAWQIARAQVRQRVERQFERESQRVIDLVRERMQKYEDALWAGVSTLDALGGEATLEEWRTFSRSMKIEQKYPGINGIGFIHSVPRSELDGYLEAQRRERPGFGVHPAHDLDRCYPITYIEPVAGNEKAVGLDMSHESNRFQAAERARVSGRSQITGPIVLVQDAQRTPGFLFYAPHYREVEGGREFLGMVYAPFVVKRLMEGTLDKATRHVDVRLRDGGETIYDELTESEADFDPDPLYSTRVTVPMYGRSWEFLIRSSRAFRSAQSTSQPLVILIGGIVIDSLVLGLFVLLSRSNRRAERYAAVATRELHRRNEELERFAYTASHDLKSPIYAIQGFAGCAQRDLENERFDRLSGFVAQIDEASTGMRERVDDLLELSRVGRVADAPEPVDLGAVAREVASSLAPVAADAGATVEIAPSMPSVHADPRRVRQVLHNLVENALTHGRSPGGGLRVVIDAAPNGPLVRLRVRDNGPGIAEDYRAQVFGLFKQLDPGAGGTGVGLAIVRRIAEFYGGTAWIESGEGGGVAVCVSLPAEVGASRPA